MVAASAGHAQVPTTAVPPRHPRDIKLEQRKPPSNNWLPDADTDTDRFRRLQISLRGFDQPMWEVGHRYQAVYDAVKDGNHALADYHWDKVKVTIQTGLMKRSARTQNSEGMFLDGAWKEMNEAIKSKNQERIEKQFGNVRQVCMACHVAEKVPFMNETPLFRNTASFGK